MRWAWDSWAERRETHTKLSLSAERPTHLAVEHHRTPDDTARWLRATEIDRRAS